LTWLLSGIYWEDSKLRDILIFKGGTAIRKVTFLNGVFPRIWTSLSCRTLTSQV
jgi:predicted nucleotidyltransferase component of viral defense system